tara:strand:+ start:401 stop:1135 length:735 start_codon:yes stop_codon:yes gene_type:complete
MTRLITFGDSNTYGIGLPDVWDGPEGGEYGESCRWQRAGGLKLTGMFPPSQFAWPQVLANKLKIDCINKGIPGSSNKEIWWGIINFKFEPTDIVIVAWSFFDRSYLLGSTHSSHRLSIWKDDKLSKLYFKYFHSKQEQFYDFYLRCNHVEFLLNDKVSKLKQSNHSEFSLKEVPEFNKVNFIKNIMTRNDTVATKPIEVGKEFGWDFIVDSAADRPTPNSWLTWNHPGVKSHENYANYIKNILC